MFLSNRVRSFTANRGLGRVLVEVPMMSSTAVFGSEARRPAARGAVPSLSLDFNQTSLPARSFDVQQSSCPIVLSDTPNKIILLLNDHSATVAVFGCLGGTPAFRPGGGGVCSDTARALDANPRAGKTSRRDPR